jgi:hypothetical protein
MFKNVVEKLIPNGSCADVPFSGREIRVFTELHNNINTSHFFEKRGRTRFFIGTAEDLLPFEDEIMSNLGKSVAVQQQHRQMTVQEVDQTAHLTDEELFEKIDGMFTSLALLSNAAASMKIRSMIVPGSPGIGKTYEVEKAMRTKAAQDKTFYWHHLKGSVSTIALYMELYHARNGVLILDDTDQAFTDPESLQLIKAATESNKKRLVSYRKLSLALENEGIPTEFEFEGCVIILTNTDLEAARKTKQNHYDAIISRAHYINVVLRSDREKIMRIRHVISTSGLLHSFLKEELHKEVIDFVEENHAKFRELSIRTVVKLAELVNSFPEHWKTLAKSTLLTN